MADNDNNQFQPPSNRSQDSHYDGVGAISPDTDQLIDQQSINLVQNTVNSLPVEASDTDLIEKEWVTLLQNVVSHTAEDPHSQQSEISKVKADYIKKRYGKIIKRGD